VHSLAQCLRVHYVTLTNNERIKVQIERERFEAWLFSQPREREVNIGDGHDCVICCFIKETACGVPEAISWHQFTVDNVPVVLPLWFKKVININTPFRRTTFGDVQDVFRTEFPEDLGQMSKTPNAPSDIGAQPTIKEQIANV